MNNMKAKISIRIDFFWISLQIILVWSFISNNFIAPFLTNNKLRLIFWSLFISSPRQYVTSHIPQFFQAVSARKGVCLSSEANYLNCSNSSDTGKNSFLLESLNLCARENGISPQTRMKLSVGIQNWKLGGTNKSKGKLR